MASESCDVDESFLYDCTHTASKQRVSYSETEIVHTAEIHEITVIWRVV